MCMSILCYVGGAVGAGEGGGRGGRPNVRHALRQERRWCVFLTGPGQPEKDGRGLCIFWDGIES